MGQFGAMEGVGSLFRSGKTLIFVDSQPKKTPDPLAHTQMRQTDPLPPGETMSEPFPEAQVAIQFIDNKLDQLRGILDEFPDPKIWERPQVGLVSLGNLICHVAGSMRDWFENGLAQQSWTRDRQFEFDRTEGMSKSELRTHLDDTRAHCSPFLDSITSVNWNDSRVFRSKTYTVRDIILHQLDHISYHSGQAAFLRRLVAELPPVG